MKNASDPSVHRQREQQFVQHVEKLLADDRLRVDTTRGRRPVTTLIRDVTRGDRSVDLKRMMSEMNRPDRELQSKMPVGESVEVVLSQTKWWVFRSAVGRLRVICVSPTRSLIAGETPAPMSPSDVSKVIKETPPPLVNVPSTLVILSTGGFTLEAHEMAARTADRTVVLVEPNDAGGWAVYGPPETKALADLFDPEAETEKRNRVRSAIDSARADLLGSGVGTDRIAQKVALPVPLVEAELKLYAKENPGLVAKRLDGNVVLFRESAAPVSAAGAGGGEMPFIDRVKSLFARKGDTEKKIAFLAERRAALSQQREQGYEDMAALEKKEADLRQQFKDAGGDITKRRVTSQLLQLRKDIERRQQLLSVLNQQIDVVGTHLHNLELVQQGTGAKLPDSDELASDAAKAEDVLAELEATTELASSMTGAVHAGMSAEEQALFEELERESRPPEKAVEPPAVTEKAKDTAVPNVPQKDKPVIAAAASTNKTRRSEAEPG